MSTEMTEDQRLARQVTIAALDMSRVPEPENPLEKTLDRVVRRHGEDAIREFVRMTVVRRMTPEEAGTFIAGDGALGQQLWIVTSRIEQAIDADG